jgi:microcystin-dependent protein
MVSAYTTNKAFEKPANGDYVDTWNIPVNGDWDIADRAFGGTFSVSLTNANVTLTQANCQNVRIRLTGSLSANVIIYFPSAVSGFFIVQNATTGTYSVTLASAGGGAGTVLTEQGRTAFVFTEGTNVFYADDSRVAITAGTGITITGTTTLTVALTTPVAVANGGTGTATATGTAGSVVLSNSPTIATPTISSANLTGTPVAPTASAGTNTTQVATTAFVTAALAATVPAGVILLWSGSVASIPSGWALCNGSSGTPDLRDRFVVGAGSTYAVAATGGADSITLNSTQIPSHTHTFSATTGNMSANSTHTHTINDPGHTHNYNVPSFTSPGILTVGSEAPSQTATATTSSTTGISLNSASVQHTHTVSGTTDATGGGLSHENRPPYYALAYIMKL